MESYTIFRRDGSFTWERTGKKQHDLASKTGYLLSQTEGKEQEKQKLGINDQSETNHRETSTIQQVGGLRRDITVTRMFCRDSLR